MIATEAAALIARALAGARTIHFGELVEAVRVELDALVADRTALQHELVAAVAEMGRVSLELAEQQRLATSLAATIERMEATSGAVVVWAGRVIRGLYRDLEHERCRRACWALASFFGSEAFATEMRRGGGS